MMDWFKAGGWGMFPILFIGVAGIVVGMRAAREPTKHRMALLKSLPTLIVVNALFAFGTNLWAVNTHLASDAFLKARDIGSAELPFIAMMGVTEAGQALTLGGLLATIVVALRLVAELRQSRAVA
jgi:hypothetical protein